MDKKDWTLLIAGLADGKPLTPVQLQKTLFLLRQLLPVTIDESDFYDFQPYNYGPFCAEIYTDAESLQRDGLMNITASRIGNWKEYAVTSSGREAAFSIARDFEPNDIEYIKNLVEWVRSLSFSQLLSSVYSKWPEYKVNSIFEG